MLGKGAAGETFGAYSHLRCDKGGFALRFVLLTDCFPRLLCIALFLLLCPVLALQSVPRIQRRVVGGPDYYTVSRTCTVPRYYWLVIHPAGARNKGQEMERSTLAPNMQPLHHAMLEKKKEECRVSHLVHRPAIHVRAWSMNIQQRSHSQQLTSSQARSQPLSNRYVVGRSPRFPRIFGKRKCHIKFLASYESFDCPTY